ncbi:MAG: DM13 domain-containing protein [Chloroflexi bacterium]|nr:DM13 domain-containing protein [Chloroflexota bacterium]
MITLRRIYSDHRQAVTFAAGAVSILVLALGWWLASPLFINDTVDEDFPMAAGAVLPEGVTMADVETTMATLAKMDDEQQEAMPSDMGGATVVAEGDFRDADSFHTGSGKARLYRLADGSHVLRFEDFDVTNGPDLRVILSPNPQEREDATATGYVELAKLKGNVGNQNYALPAGLDPGAFGAVVIYCKPFRVIFSTAPLVAD